jgi:ribonuclease-3
MDLKEIQEKLNYKFRDWTLAEAAFTHSSYANETGSSSYERLEFLGDSVVNLTAAEALYKKYPDKNEGFLSKARAKVVSGKTLAAVIGEMDIAKHLITGSGVIGQEAKESEHVLADLFESIAGAIFLDGGIDAAKAFVSERLKDALQIDYTKEPITDFKSKLLEYAAKKGKKAKFNCGSSLSSKYHATVTLDGKVLGQGEGESKKTAEQNASNEALLRLNLSVVKKTDKL